MTNVYLGALIVCGICILGTLVFAARGPRFTDKVVAANLVSTIVVNMICILAIFLGADYILDVAMLYALISFAITAVLCRVVVLHHNGRLRHVVTDDEARTEREAYDRLEEEEKRGAI